jgi:hypothetical protein
MEASTSRKQVAEETPTSAGALTTLETLATARTPGTATSERIKASAGLTATQKVLKHQGTQTTAEPS